MSIEITKTEFNYRPNKLLSEIPLATSVETRSLRFLLRVAYRQALNIFNSCDEYENSISWKYNYEIITFAWYSLYMIFDIVHDSQLFPNLIIIQLRSSFFPCYPWKNYFYAGYVLCIVKIGIMAYDRAERFQKLITQTPAHVGPGTYDASFISRPPRDLGT